MRLISEYINETKLSVSFFIDRITPAALYFLPIIIIATMGSSYQISSYSVFSSLFTTFIAIPLGFTSAVRYYSSLKSESERFIPGSSFILISFISVISVLIYFMYYGFVFYKHGYDNFFLVTLFAICILITAPYYALTSYNEGKKNVRVNNICGVLAIPLLIVGIMVFKNHMDIVSACALSFLLTRILMLSIAIIGFEPKNALMEASRVAMANIAKYGISIASLFFIQKLVSTIIISFLSSSSIQISSFQLVTVASMLMSLTSNAIFTNAFISIVKKSEKTRSVFFICVINTLILLLIMLPMTYWSVNGFLGNLIGDHDVLNAIKENINIIVFYFAADVVMTASFVISRACGDTWKCQSIWCVGVLSGLLFTGFNIDLGSSLKVFIFADALSVLMCMYNLSKDYSIFNEKVESK